MRNDDRKGSFNDEYFFYPTNATSKVLDRFDLSTIDAFRGSRGSRVVALENHKTTVAPLLLSYQKNVI